ncbi:MAG: alpha/beta fold hydrolase [Phycisphaerae bacterium]
MPRFTEMTVTLRDGYAAYARYFAVTRPRGAVLYHHGIQSHCGWYETSAERLQDAGFAVLQVDRRGCGRNGVDRGHAESAEQLVQDSLAARDVLLRVSGCGGYDLVGVSWGGRLVVATYITDATGVRSMSLVTPGLFPLVGVSKARASEIASAMLYEREKPFDIPLNDPERFTASAKWQRFHRTDALTLRQATAGFYLASRRMDRWFGRLKACPPVPMHVLLAGDERIIDNDKTTGFVAELGWPDTRVTTYAAARHSLEYERDAEVYFRDLVGFIASAR